MSRKNRARGKDKSVHFNLDESNVAENSNSILDHLQQKPMDEITPVIEAEAEAELKAIMDYEEQIHRDKEDLSKVDNKSLVIEFDSNQEVSDYNDETDETDDTGGDSDSEQNELEVGPDTTDNKSLETTVAGPETNDTESAKTEIELAEPDAVKTDETNLFETETEANETEPSEIKLSDTEPTETDTNETEPVESELTEIELAEPEAVKTDETNLFETETEANETEPSEIKLSDTEPTETDTNETEPVESELTETAVADPETNETYPSDPTEPDTNEETSKDLSVNISTQKPKTLSDGGSKSNQGNLVHEKITLIMGMVSHSVGNSVVQLFGKSLQHILNPSYDNLEKLQHFLKNKIINSYRFTNDNFINQRLSIYSQLYQSGGIYMNPSHIKLNNPGLIENLNRRPTNIFLLLDREKSPDRCKNSAQKHSIRNGRPERRYVISHHFLYSKKPSHPFWLDLLRLSNDRYNQVVPKGEQIESISKYGQHYLAGSDLLSELVYQTQNKYNDILVLTRELLSKIIAKTSS